MEKSQTVLLPCHLTRSGFSGERVFRLTLADQSEYVGVAPIDYCRHQDRSPLGPDDPAKGGSIEGFVEGQVLANGGQLAHVVVPDGEVIQVSIQQIRFIKSKQTDYVPI